jgi:hypothetical protein
MNVNVIYVRRRMFLRKPTKLFWVYIATPADVSKIWMQKPGNLRRKSIEHVQVQARNPKKWISTRMHHSSSASKHQKKKKNKNKNNYWRCVCKKYPATVKRRYFAVSFACVSWCRRQSTLFSRPNQSDQRLRINLSIKSIERIVLRARSKILHWHWCFTFAFAYE